MFKASGRIKIDLNNAQNYRAMSKHRRATRLSCRRHSRRHRYNGIIRCVTVLSALERFIDDHLRRGPDVESLQVVIFRRIRLTDGHKYPRYFTFRLIETVRAAIDLGCELTREIFIDRSTLYRARTNISLSHSRDNYN